MKPCVVFEHIPKAAGTTFQRILSGRFGKRSTFVIDGSRPAESHAAFRALPARQRARFHLVMGHGAYQLRDALPQGTRLITFLRDPVDRVVSHYYFVRRSPDHHLYDQVVGSGLSLRAYAEGPFAELHNNYVARFSGCSAEQLHSEPARALALARDALGTFAFVGITEQFDASLLLLRRELGWGALPFYWKENVTIGRVPVQDVDEAALAAIRGRNQLDLELYAEALQRFEQAKARLGRLLDLELSLFRRANAAFQLAAEPVLRAVRYGRMLLPPTRGG